MNDLAMAPIWLAVNGVLVFTCGRLSRKLFPGDAWWQLAGHITLLAYATVVLSGALLGAVGVLYPGLFLGMVVPGERGAFSFSAASPSGCSQA